MIRRDDWVAVSEPNGGFSYHGQVVLAVEDEVDGGHILTTARRGDGTRLLAHTRDVLRIEGSAFAIQADEKQRSSETAVASRKAPKAGDKAARPDMLRRILASSKATKLLTDEVLTTIRWFLGSGPPSRRMQAAITEASKASNAPATTGPTGKRTGASKPTASSTGKRTPPRTREERQAAATNASAAAPDDGEWAPSGLVTIKYGVGLERYSWVTVEDPSDPDGARQIGEARRAWRERNGWVVTVALVDGGGEIDVQGRYLEFAGQPEGATTEWPEVRSRGGHIISKGEWLRVDDPEDDTVYGEAIGILRRSDRSVMVRIDTGTSKLTIDPLFADPSHIVGEGPNDQSEG